MSGKVFEAQEHCKTAEKALKTSVFRWKPDYDSAADEYTVAAQCYRIARELPKSKECHLKAAECFKKINAFFHAAKALENAMIVCKEIATPQEIFDLAMESGSLYQQHGSGDSGASVLDKGAKIIEGASPELAVKLFQQAADVSSDLEKEKNVKMLAQMVTDDWGDSESSDIEVLNHVDAKKEFVAKQPLMAAVASEITEAPGDTGAWGQPVDVKVLLEAKPGPASMMPKLVNEPATTVPASISDGDRSADPKDESADPVDQSADSVDDLIEDIVVPAEGRVYHAGGSAEPVDGLIEELVDVQYERVYSVHENTEPVDEYAEIMETYGNPEAVRVDPEAVRVNPEAVRDDRVDEIADPEFAYPADVMVDPIEEMADPIFEFLNLVNWSDDDSWLNLMAERITARALALLKDYAKVVRKENRIRMRYNIALGHYGTLVREKAIELQRLKNLPGLRDLFERVTVVLAYRQLKEHRTESSQHQGSEYISKASRILVKLQWYDQAVDSLRREIGFHQESGNTGAIGRLTVAIVLVQLARGDAVAAEKAYKEWGSNCEVAEMQTLEQILQAYDEEDRESAKRALASPFIRNMDVEYARLAATVPLPEAMEPAPRAAVRENAAPSYVSPNAQSTTTADITHENIEESPYAPVTYVKKSDEEDGLC